VTPEQRAVLEALRLNWARKPQEVWKDTASHVAGLHPQAVRGIDAGLADALDDEDANPLGLVIQGQRGSGKTHLLGQVRERVQSFGGYFFLIGPLNGNSFWESVSLALAKDLLRELPGRRPQLPLFLARLADQLDVESPLRDAVVGAAPLERDHLKRFIDAFRGRHRVLGRETQDTLRALILLGSHDYEDQDVAEAYLLGLDEGKPDERAIRGMHPAAKAAGQIVQEMTSLLALTGPSVIAIDQIDTISAESSGTRTDDLRDDRAVGPMFDQVADGLLQLRDVTTRTLVIVSCLPNTWILLKEKAVATVTDRFREPFTLRRIDSPQTGVQIVGRHFMDRLQAKRLTSPYPTWPLRPEAFESAPSYTPRQLLQLADRHVQRILSSGIVEEVLSLEDDGDGGAKKTPVEVPPAGGLGELDARFAALLACSDATPAIAADNEDDLIPRLLSAGLSAWIMERGDDGDAFEQETFRGAKPALHGKLRQTLDETTGEEIHWAFRAVTSGHAIAALTRVRAACTSASIEHSGGKRRLFLLRNADWSKGKQTREVLGAFEAAGGRTLNLIDDDLRTFAALEMLLAEDNPRLSGWLVARRPASNTMLLRTALADLLAPTSPGPGPGPTSRDPGTNVDASQSDASPGGVGTRPRIAVDLTGERGAAAEIDLEILRRHTAIFAGSGSGKTVLIRRLVEECALHGASSIILDPNNDLARFGDSWPGPPAGWRAGDVERARDYLDNTDVVIWTPRHTGGRPLTFRPLPEFSAVADDRHEFDMAIDAATTTLAARAGVTGATGKAPVARAVLRQALETFARGRRSSDLHAFIRELADSPGSDGSLDPDGKLARNLAQALEAAAVNDPLFGGAGEPADPGMLLTPDQGKRARVSVINFVGLPNDAQRQGFVNQLQLALFAWAKKNPAGDRPLGGLFVMDEAQTFAPSGAETPCTKSTIALAQQLRKYGLGMIFGTQAPRGIHSHLVGNATTQFYGLLSAPAQIDAAREVARAKGGDVPDIARLKTGQFYLSSEGIQPRKIQTPMCLSHHPRSPLSEEEVLKRARASRR